MDYPVHMALAEAFLLSIGEVIHVLGDLLRGAHELLLFLQSVEQVEVLVQCSGSDDVVRLGGSSLHRRMVQCRLTVLLSQCPLKLMFRARAKGLGLCTRRSHGLL